jgi:hypothetical protein
LQLAQHGLQDRQGCDRVAQVVTTHLQH